MTKALHLIRRIELCINHMNLGWYAPCIAYNHAQYVRFSEIHYSAIDLKRSVSAAMHRIDSKHESIAESAGDVAKATRVVAGVASVGAAIAMPTGLAAAGVFFGITSAPLLVTAAPVLVSVAATAATVSAAMHLYSKARRKRQVEFSNQSETLVSERKGA